VALENVVSGSAPFAYSIYFVLAFLHPDSLKWCVTMRRRIMDLVDMVFVSKHSIMRSLFYAPCSVMLMCLPTMWHACDFHMQCVVLVLSACADVKLGFVHGGTLLSGGSHWVMFSKAIRSLLSGEAWHGCYVVSIFQVMLYVRFKIKCATGVEH